MTNPSTPSLLSRVRRLVEALEKINETWADAGEYRAIADSALTDAPALLAEVEAMEAQLARFTAPPSEGELYGYGEVAARAFHSQPKYHLWKTAAEAAIAAYREAVGVTE